MSDSAESARKVGKFSQIKAEFKKIIWPDKKSAAKQSLAVIVISALPGVIIALLDIVLRYGVDFIISL